MHPVKRPGAEESVKKANRITDALSLLEAKTLPEWIAVDPQAQQGNVVGSPAREEITLPIQEQLIIELYSR